MTDGIEINSGSGTKTSWGGTAITLFAMLIYGYFCLWSESISFDATLFFGIILFVFILELISNVFALAELKIRSEIDGK